MVPVPPVLRRTAPTPRIGRMVFIWSSGGGRRRRGGHGSGWGRGYGPPRGYGGGYGRGYGRGYGPPPGYGYPAPDHPKATTSLRASAASSPAAASPSTDTW